jgi:hypothetical protein
MRFVRDLAVTLGAGFLVGLVAILVDPKQLARAFELGFAACVIVAVLLTLLEIKLRQIVARQLKLTWQSPIRWQPIVQRTSAPPASPAAGQSLGEVAQGQDVPFYEFHLEPGQRELLRAMVQAAVGKPSEPFTCRRVDEPEMTPSGGFTIRATDNPSSSPWAYVLRHSGLPGAERSIHRLDLETLARFNLVTLHMNWSDLPAHTYLNRRAYSYLGHMEAREELERDLPEGPKKAQRP